MLSDYKKSTLLTLTLCLAPMTAPAEVYVYLGESGDRIISDKPLQRKGYRLQHLRRDLKDIGHIAAGREIELKNSRLYDNYIESSSQKFNLDPALVKAVIRVESDFNPMAISPKGALGLMQLMPHTAARYRERDLFSPVKNIDVGTRHLSYLMQRYGQDTRLVLAAYNAGEHNVDRYRGIPPFKETKQYVTKVMKYHDLYSATQKNSKL